MAGQGASQSYTQTTVSDEVFNVRLTQPITDNSSKEIRDNVLLDFFGYSEFDIKALDEQKKGYFYISDERTPKEWATANQIKTWNFNPDGTVRITMPRKLIDNLILFRAQRASLEIFKIGAFVADASIRDELVQDLEQIFNNSGQKRIEALNRLMVTIEGSGASRPQIYQALRFLTNESGYKNNPFLLIAFARTTVYQSDAPSMGSSQISRTQIDEAIRATNASLYNLRTKSALAKISKEEAAAINRWASELYDKSDAREDALRRKWVSRFLAMSDDERRAYKEGDIIEELPAGATVIRNPTQSEQRLADLDNRWAQRQRMEQSINSIGSPVPPSDPRSSEFFQTPADKLQMNDALIRQKNRGSQQGYVSKYKTVNVSTPVFRGANMRADGVGAVFHILIEVFRYKGAGRRMSEIADYYNKRSWLVKQVEREKRRVVPPEPKKIRQAILDVRKYGRTTGDYFVKRNVPMALKELEIILEESNAFYNSPK